MILEVDQSWFIQTTYEQQSELVSVGHFFLRNKNESIKSCCSIECLYIFVTFFATSAFKCSL